MTALSPDGYTEFTMVHNPTSAQLDPADEIWSEIENLIDEVAGLSKSQLSNQQFHAALLDRAVQGLAAVGGAIWTQTADGKLQLEYQINLANSGFADQDHHLALLGSALKHNRPRAFAPHSGTANQPEESNPTDYLLLVSPLVGEQGTLGLVEVFQRAETSPAAQRGYLQLLETLCELASDFHRNQQLRAMQQQATIWSRYEQFVDEVHGSLELQRTAYVIANEGRRIIDCDRLSVAVVHGSKMRITAVSGLDSIDRRANAIRHLEELVNAVIAADEPLWHVENSVAKAPQIEVPLQAYLDESNSRMLAVIPLRERKNDEQQRERNRSIAALVIERFDSEQDSGVLRQRAGVLLRPAALALQNSLDHENLPFYSVLQFLKKTRLLGKSGRFPKLLTGLILAVVVIATLTFVPASFHVEGHGELQPERRREVFAGSNGVVSQVSVQHADSVKINDVLVVLEKPQLDFEISRTLGEMQTARKRLSGLEASRLGISSGQTGNGKGNKYNNLAAEVEEVRELLKGLEEQRAILKKQRLDLSIVSPMDGQVLTWNISELLESRPVERGQILMTVADLNGPWVVELQVPDDRIGHVIEAQRNSEQSLDVSFVLATDPGQTYHGTVERIAMTTDTQGRKAATVRVTVKFDRDMIPDLKRRPGATVIPKIDCGQRALGYVWFHDLIDAVQKWFLF